MKRKLKVFIAALMVTIFSMGNVVCYADVSRAVSGSIRGYNISGSFNIYTTYATASLTSTGYVELDVHGKCIVSYMHSVKEGTTIYFSGNNSSGTFVYASTSVPEPDEQRINSGDCTFTALYDTAIWADTISVDNP